METLTRVAYGATYSLVTSAARSVPLPLWHAGSKPNENVVKLAIRSAFFHVRFLKIQLQLLRSTEPFSKQGPKFRYHICGWRLTSKPFLKI